MYHSSNHLIDKPRTGTTCTHCWFLLISIILSLILFGLSALITDLMFIGISKSFNTDELVINNNFIVENTVTKSFLKNEDVTGPAISYNNSLYINTKTYYTENVELQDGVFNKFIGEFIDINTELTCVGKTSLKNTNIVGSVNIKGNTKITGDLKATTGEINELESSTIITDLLSTNTLDVDNLDLISLTSDIGTINVLTSTSANIGDITLSGTLYGGNAALDISTIQTLLGNISYFTKVNSYDMVSSKILISDLITPIPSDVMFHLQSNGPVQIWLQSDWDNINEADVPLITMTDDGQAGLATIGLSDADGMGFFTGNNLGSTNGKFSFYSTQRIDNGNNVPTSGTTVKFLEISNTATTVYKTLSLQSVGDGINDQDVLTVAPSGLVRKMSITNLQPPQPLDITDSPTFERVSYYNLGLTYTRWLKSMVVTTAWQSVTSLQLITGDPNPLDLTTGYYAADNIGYYALDIEGTITGSTTTYIDMYISSDLSSEHRYFKRMYIETVGADDLISYSTGPILVGAANNYLVHIKADVSCTLELNGFWYRF